MKRIAVFGSTGSIGQNLIDLVRKNQDRYQLVLLACNRNVQELVKQLKLTGARRAHILDESAQGSFPGSLRLEHFILTEMSRLLICSTKRALILWLMPLSARQDWKYPIIPLTRGSRLLSPIRSPWSPPVSCSSAPRSARGR